LIDHPESIPEDWAQEVFGVAEHHGLDVEYLFVGTVRENRYTSEIAVPKMVRGESGWSWYWLRITGAEIDTRTYRIVLLKEHNKKYIKDYPIA
jgi:hypothetical protein